MRFALVLALLLASPALASDTIYVCSSNGRLSAHSKQIQCEDGSTASSTTKDDPAWLNELQRRANPTQQEKDRAFDRAARRSATFRTFLEVYAEREGITLDELLTLMRAKR